MKHAGTQQLETERLLLRRYISGDETMMFSNWANDSRVTKYLTWPVHSSVDVTKSLIDLWISNYDAEDFYHWGIVDKDTLELIGDISVVHSNEDVFSAEIGYCLGPDYWGKGYMAETLCAVIAFLFRNTEYRCITARHDTNNPNSGIVMQKVGMKYEGILRQSAKNNQGIVDMAHYSILKQEVQEVSRNGY